MPAVISNECQGKRHLSEVRQKRSELANQGKCLLTHREKVDQQYILGTYAEMRNQVDEKVTNRKAMPKGMKVESADEKNQADISYDM